MPRNEDNTALWGQVFIVNDVDFAKPNRDEGTEKPSEKTVASVDARVMIPHGVLQPSHGGMKPFLLLSLSPAAGHGEFA